MADFEIPGYDIFERVGRGGMASVYRALHLNLDREIAIKVMDPAMSSDESFSERFIREARISARLTHPHILQIYDVNQFDGMNYIAMEYLAAGDLGDFIHKEMQQRTIYGVMKQMTDALDYASGRGYVHRDIKPSNIMLRADNDFVLTDFGIARAANSGTQMTQTGLMVGTPSYMSPEQAKGQEVDGRSDLYALAVLCYEMLTKTLPYESESAVTTAVKHLTEDIPTLQGALEVYQPFFNKAMAKKADDRYQTGRELYQAFMESSAGFSDDEVLTEALESAPEGAEERKETLQSSPSTSLVSDITQVSPGGSIAGSGSRPYKLTGSEQRERLVSGIHKRPASKSSGGRAIGLAVALAIVGGAGYFGYDYWQQQQARYDEGLRTITAEMAAAYGAIDENRLPEAMASFNKVLVIDSENAAANDGIARLEEIYTASIEHALATENLDTAGPLIDEYAATMGPSASLTRFQSEFVRRQEEELKEAERQAAALAEQEAAAQELAEQQAWIDESLAQAAEALEQMADEPDMAVQAATLYQEILALDAGNSDAVSGLAEVADYYVGLANEAVESGDFKTANDILVSADELMPGQLAINNLQQSLPALETAWEEQQAAAALEQQLAAEARERELAEAERAREAAAAAEQEAIEVADQGLAALQRGDVESAQAAYDSAASSHPELDATVELRSELQLAYARFAEEKIASKEFDAALQYVSLGMSVAPDDPGWAELQAQIETSQAGSRRRLGAY